jgi:hypothetical protein
MNATIATENRNESFFAKIEEFSLRRKTTYQLIKTYQPITTQELKRKMLLGVNQVSGRVTELAQSFYIKPVGTKINEHSKMPNTLWAITTPDERIDLMNAAYVKLIDEQDTLINHLNVTEPSISVKITLKKRIAQITKIISQIEIL